MTRWIDMTDAQKAAKTAQEAAKARAKILQNPAAIKAVIDALEQEAAEIEAQNGRFSLAQAARVRDDMQPIFAMLARLNIDRAEIGV